VYKHTHTHTHTHVSDICSSQSFETDAFIKISILSMRIGNFNSGHSYCASSAKARLLGCCANTCRLKLRVQSFTCCLTRKAKLVLYSANNTDWRCLRTFYGGFLDLRRRNRLLEKKFLVQHSAVTQIHKGQESTVSHNSLCTVRRNLLSYMFRLTCKTATTRQ
jgi:hypothetical protein